MYGNDEIMEQLSQIALKQSRPFCYSCYRSAPTGQCATCGSDDLMREVPGVGVEHGVGWIRDHLVETSLKPIDLDAAFEDSICELYAETVHVGWIEVDVATAIKELDPISWRIAKGEWVDQMLDDGSFMSFDNGSTCYRTHDVEQFIERN